MTDFQPWQSRPKRHDWRAWIIAAAAVVLLVAALTLAWGAEGAGIPPRPGTEKTLPLPPGRHEMRLYCHNFVSRPDMSAECRRIGGYR